MVAKEVEEWKGGRGCSSVFSDRPIECTSILALPPLSLLSSHANGAFSLPSIRHSPERPWQALYEPPPRIILCPTIEQEGEGGGSWGLQTDTPRVVKVVRVGHCATYTVTECTRVITYRNITCDEVSTKCKCIGKLGSGALRPVCLGRGKRGLWWSE